MSRNLIFVIFITLCALIATFAAMRLLARNEPGKPLSTEPIAAPSAHEPQVETKSNLTQKDSVKVKEIKQRIASLTPIQRAVTQEGATERPFTGVYDKHFEAGQYICIVCGEKLFTSESKFDAGCGWPSFKDTSGYIEELPDDSFGMQRIEVRCGNCGAHLGHVFTDGPAPTGLRYCINSASLNFIPQEEKK